MRFVTIVKKMGVPFLGIILFVSCNSDDSGTVKKNVSQEEKNYTKELILKKLVELGLDPANVSFTDEIKPGECIMLKSLDDLEKIFPRDTILREEEMLPVLDTLQDNSTATRYRRNWDLRDYCYYSGQFPVRGALYMNMNLSFNYNRNLLDARQFDAITNVFTDITGFTLGVSYNQSFYHFNVDRGAPYEVTVEGIFNYNLFFESVGTVYRRRLITKGRFSPSLSKYGGYPSFAFFTAYFKDMG
ncbi:MAG: hypothetical protein E2604_05415 [Flavobacterium sp.]|nr:hypothetical protein [Flavobacterium sp.]